MRRTKGKARKKNFVLCPKPFALKNKKNKNMEIVRFSTAGSVDDGKSTLIGRLLYDTNSLSKDRLENITQLSAQRGLDHLDLSLITDGLTAEREQ